MSSFKKLVHSTIFLSLCFGFSFAAEIEIPDIETKIKHTGNAVPESALPPLKKPAQVIVPQEPIQSVNIEEFFEPIVEEDDDFSLPEPLVSSAIILPSLIHGFLSYELGLPLFMYAEADIHRDFTHSGNFPFDANIRWEKIDYALHDATSSLTFKEQARFDFSIPKTKSIDTLFSIAFDEIKNGFVSYNEAVNYIKTDQFFLESFPIYFDNLSVFGKKIIEIKVGLSTGALIFSPDLILPFNNPNVEILKEKSFFVCPQFLMNIKNSIGNIGFIGSYFYESYVNSSQFMYVDLGIQTSLDFNFGELEAKANVLYDSNQGVLVPFKITGTFGTKTHPKLGEPTNFFAQVSGGLDYELQNRAFLMRQEPFIQTQIPSLIASDFFGLFIGELFDSSGISAHSEIETRFSAFNRNLYYLTGSMLDSGLAEVDSKNRNYIRSSLAVAWTSNWLTAQTGYEGFWLEHLRLEPAQIIFVGFQFKDKKALPIWSAGGESKFFFDYTQLPLLSFNASLHPSNSLDLSFYFDDALVWFLAKERIRNTLYADSLGAIRLQAKISF